MHVITKRRLSDFAREHPDAEPSLRAWQKVAEKARWNTLLDVQRQWPSAEAVGSLTVFNIAGNKYRLITRVDYIYNKVFIRAILPHAEYSKERWKYDNWY